MELKHHVKGGSIKRRVFWNIKASTGGQTGALGSLSLELHTEGLARKPTGIRSEVSSRRRAPPKPVFLPLPPLGSLSSWVGCCGTRCESPPHTRRTEKQNSPWISSFPSLLPPVWAVGSWVKTKDQRFGLLDSSWTGGCQGWGRRTPSVRGAHTLIKGLLILTKPYQPALRSRWCLLVRI